ncbi:GH17321 [Drosophila grimshawi]|uniref:GH17321 n=1 Tax=Drosophila grimshawi TaxID=7222 RepID=B4JUN5_DROGR|nr:GH17321 [Drosophila grimshawi]
MTSTNTSSTQKIPIRYPFMVSIQIIENGKYKHLCGGTILNKYFVITAAHCTLLPQQLYAKNLFVIGGSNMLYDRKSIRFRVRELKRHPKFQPFHGNDIMLLQLTSAIPLDNLRFSAIDFRQSYRVDKDLHLILLGWGRTKVQTPKNIEVVHFRTMSNAKCFVNYKFKYLKNGDICANNTKGDRGACDGDSGGPLIDEQLNYLHGVLSYGRKPCVKGRIYVFTRMSEYIGWIKRQMGKMTVKKPIRR